VKIIALVCPFVPVYAAELTPPVEAASDANEPQPLPSEWNVSNSYAFRYSHPQSAMEYVVKVGRLGNKATVDAIAVEAGKRASFDIDPNDYISGSSLPSTPLPPDGSLTAASATMQTIFISPARLSDLGSLLKLRIIQPLAPGLSKAGYEDSGSTTAPQRAPSPRAPATIPSPSAEPAPARPYVPFADPLAAPRRPPLPPGLEPPGFDDEYDVLRPPGRLPGGPLPPGLGARDLYPPGLGPLDPLRPHFAGGGLGGVPGGLGGPGAGGGMHPTFDDPLFGGAGEGNAGGRDPRVPPGARYDPTGPGDPRAGMGFGGAGRRGPPNPFGGFGSGDFI